MICPYRTANLLEKQYINRKYNTDSAQETDTTIITTQEYDSRDCTKENCAVWYDNKCNYKL